MWGLMDIPYPIVFDCIEEYAPGFKQLVVGKEVLTPPDLERIFGLTGGVSYLPPSYPSLPYFLNTLEPLYILLPHTLTIIECIPWLHVIGPALHVQTNPT